MARYRRCRYPNCHAMVKLPDHYCKQHYNYEAEYLAKRQRWARSHNTRYQQKYNHITRNRNNVKSQQYKFYHTKTWVDLRRQVLNRDHFVCQYCGKPNAKTVDHIVPIEYDAKLKADVNNLAVICLNCHRLKTDWEQIYYGTGECNELKQVQKVHDLKTIARLMNKIPPK